MEVSDYVNCSSVYPVTPSLNYGSYSLKIFFWVMSKFITKASRAETLVKVLVLYSVEFHLWRG